MSVTVHHGDSRDVLKGMADSSVDSVVSDLALGTAAEHLVCADLLLAGYRTFMSDQNCPYDIAVDVAGRLIRIQVKATRGPRNVPQRVGQFPAYMWHVRRAGKGRKRLYGGSDFDLLALVAVDTRQIAYLAPSLTKQTIHIRPHEDAGPRGNKLGKVFSQFPFSRALSEVIGV